MVQDAPESKAGAKPPDTKAGAHTRLSSAQSAWPPAILLVHEARGTWTVDWLGVIHYILCGLRGVVLFVWFILALAFSALGWDAMERSAAAPDIAVTPQVAATVVIDGVPIDFASEEDAGQFLADRDREYFLDGLARPVQDLLKLPPPLLLFLCAFSFGALGGVGRQFHEFLQGAEGSAVVFPLYGGITGILLLAVTRLVPSLLAVESDATRPQALLAFCFVGGFFADAVVLRMASWFPDSIQLGRSPALAEPKKAAPNPQPDAHALSERSRTEANEAPIPQEGSQSELATHLKSEEEAR